MKIIHTIVLSFEAASNEELDDFNDYVADWAYDVNTWSRYTAQFYPHCQLVGIHATPDQRAIITAELEACLDNTPEGAPNWPVRDALHRMIADLKGGETGS